MTKLPTKCQQCGTMFDAVTTSRKCPACGLVDDTVQTVSKLKELEEELHHKNRTLCHHCGATLKFGKAKPASIAKCPQCGAKVIVPEGPDEWGPAKMILKVVAVIAFCLMAFMIKTCVKQDTERANQRARDAAGKVTP